MYRSYGRGTKNIKGCHIQQSLNLKLFGAQRRSENTKPLQFLDLMKATFECGGKKTQRSAGVRHHEGNPLYPGMDNFLKLMMQSLLFCQERRNTGLFVSYDLLRGETANVIRT
jgi:hypothetical protein